MKAYVLGYRDKEEQHGRYSAITPQSILYDKEPKWTMEYGQPVFQHSVLENMNVHLGVVDLRSP